MNLIGKDLKNPIADRDVEFVQHDDDDVRWPYWLLIGFACAYFTCGLIAAILRGGLQ